MSFFSKLKDTILGEDTSDVIKEAEESEYVELGNAKDKMGDTKVNVRPFVLQDFEAIKPVVDALREGHTIALINIKPLKDKDLIELKRAINKLKKTCDAIDGDIAGFGEDWIAAVPAFAKIHRARREDVKKDEQGKKIDEMSDYESEEANLNDDSEGKIETY